MRKEKDFIGEELLPDEALYGIHAHRAMQNFSNNTVFSKEWYKAVGLVKQACYQTAISFAKAAQNKFPKKPLPAGCENIHILEVLEEAASEVAEGKYYEHFVVPAIQGGAGTAINMNINEILSNVSLKKLGHSAGDYHIVDPFVHANIFQSTNDVIPTALKVAMMKELNFLETAINELRSAMEKLESENRNALRIAYTQLQEAVPSSFGLLFSAWCDAFSRDWWRVSKCFERIKVTNLGGGATGTGMAIPRYYIMEVTNRLRELSGIPITRSENHTDTTQNLDVFVEVHAILKSHAVNLEKVASDLRLLGSDIMGQHDLTLPRKQTGSSIMPGKINPVINEFVIGCSHKIYANDMLISNLCGQGTLELNAYLPVIGNALLESIHLLVRADESMLKHLITGMKVESHTAYEKLLKSPSISTALLPLVGYEKASEIARFMKSENVDIFEANERLGMLEKNTLIRILLPENLLKLGYSLGDL
ncbi:MAG: aspartate ammonia-lyase [Bacteroidetes bacterium]|nr:MAG: aspartate ammonia-lyase [Bacteroidota bacterium]